MEARIKAGQASGKSELSAIPSHETGAEWGGLVAPLKDLAIDFNANPALSKKRGSDELQLT